MLDQRNLLLAILLSVAIIVGFQYFYEAPRMRQLAEQQAAEQATAPGEEPGGPPRAPGDVPAPPGAPTAPTVEAPESRAAALEKTPRIKVDSPRLRGSISLVGGSIDDLTLIEYYETVDPDSPQITLLSPRGSAGAYYAEFGWVPADPSVSVPRGDIEWVADSPVLRPDRPVRLTWDNGSGLRFVRQIAVDETYMFSITQRVENKSDTAVTLYPYGLVARSGTPEGGRFGFYIHEGPVGVINGELKEKDYDDLKEDGPFEWVSNGGWMGIKDQYWLVALVPDQEGEGKVRFIHNQRNGDDKYQVDFRRGPFTVPVGGSLNVTDRLFAGAKEIRVLESYKDELGIERFHMAIDYTKLFFLTIPLHKVILYFDRLLGNIGLAILLLTVLVKLVFFPLANKSYKSMSKMKKLQPKMIELREKYKDDKQKLQQEMMALYKAENANPMSGCLPIVIQIPVFIGLYIVLLVTIEMRQAPFYGWVNDLSAPDPTSVFSLFGLLPFDLPVVLAIGVWPLIMGLTMLLQFRLNPQPADPMQARIMMMLPLFFIFLFARFPAGLVIYWTWNNLLSIAQQWFIMRRAGVPT